MPRRAHARSANDTPGTISTSTFAARSSSTVFSATFGLPGTAYTTSPCVCAASTTYDAIALYTASRSSPRVVEPVERLERDAAARRGRRSPGGERCARIALATRSNAASAAGRTRSAPAGPSPTTTTRARLTRRESPAAPWSSSRRARAVRAATALPAADDATAGSSVVELPRAVPRVDGRRPASRASSLSSATSCVFRSPAACCRLGPRAAARIWARNSS